MSTRTRNGLAILALALGLATLIFILILTALHAVGTNDALYFREQTAARVLPAAGVSEDDLKRLDDALADYLAGRPTALFSEDVNRRDTEVAVMHVDVNGADRPAFNAREIKHLQDCAGLFRLLRKVRGRLIPWAVLLIALGAWLLQERRPIRLAAWLSPLPLLIPLGAFAIWALRDFDAAFVFFHHVLFSNNLWQLDPATDLLIRICPESMFMHMGARIGLWGLAAMIAVPLTVTLLTVFLPRRRGRSAWRGASARRTAPAKRVPVGRR